MLSWWDCSVRSLRGDVRWHRWCASFRNCAVTVRGVPARQRVQDTFSPTTRTHRQLHIAGAIAVGSARMHCFRQSLPVQVPSLRTGELMRWRKAILAGVWQGLAHLERAVADLDHVKPWSRRLLPLDSASKAVRWARGGWLPCGMSTACSHRSGQRASDRRLADDARFGSVRYETARDGLCG